MSDRSSVTRTQAFAGAALATLCTVAPSVRAQTPSPADADASLGAVVVSAPRSAAPRGAPGASLESVALDARRASTLGETLSNEPGVTATYFGPNASRPVVRGLGDDRVRMTENSATVIDASAVSPDHASATEPLLAERIDVLRGPDTLRYGSGVTGGVVNVIDNRLPVAPINGPGGRVEVRAGGAQNERAGVAVIESGDGRIAWHADAHERSASDVRIPGYALTNALRTRSPGSAAAAAYGTLPNSFAHARGGGFGASITDPNGYLGASVSSFQSRYGTPASADTMIDLDRSTVELAGERRALAGPLETLRFRLTGTQYQHEERNRNTGVVDTTFRSKGLGLRAEAAHAPIGALRGTAGVQIGRVDFSALGDEAYVPATRTDSAALFVVEDWKHARLQLTGALRAEHNRVESAGDASGLEGSRFGAASARTFPLLNGSLAARWTLNSAWTLLGQASHAERAPTSVELFANGPHAATGSWEAGDANLAREKSTSLEAGTEYRSKSQRFRVNGYRTQFGNFIFASATGMQRFADANAASLPEYRYRQVPATFTGIESSLRWPLWASTPALDGEVRADYLHATDRNTGEPLPRIAPMRVGVALIHQSSGTVVRADVIRAFAQDRVASGETPTAGYTLVNLYASHRVHRSASAIWEVFARADNLLNQEARHHASFVKDMAPMPGRAALVGVRTMF